MPTSRAIADASWWIGIGANNGRPCYGAEADAALAREALHVHDRPSATV